MRAARPCPDAGALIKQPPGDIPSRIAEGAGDEGRSAYGILFHSSSPHLGWANSGSSSRWQLQLFPTLSLCHDAPGTLLSSPSLRRRFLTMARTGPTRFPRKPPALSIIQQPVLRSPHHDLLLRVDAQLHLNGVDGVSDGDHLDFPCRRNRNV